MVSHGIHLEGGRKQITCSDCGHIYLVAQGQQSSSCQKCGNIEFLNKATNAPQRKEALNSLSQEIVSRRVLPRLKEPATNSLELFLLPTDGLRVEELRNRYQVEWQLWAMLVRNFQDPAFHMAYLCQATAANQLEQAADRYREHRSVMALLQDSLWQAEVADLMLTRIENIALSRLPNYKKDYGLDLPSWMKLLPTDSRVMKIAWVAMGLFFVAKLLRFQL